jgi:hypothetical protein
MRRRVPDSNRGPVEASLERAEDPRAARDDSRRRKDENGLPGESGDRRLDEKPSDGLDVEKNVDPGRRHPGTHEKTAVNRKHRAGDSMLRAPRVEEFAARSASLFPLGTTASVPAIRSPDARSEGKFA